MTVWSRFLTTLAQPAIPVQAKNVQILSTPAQFYNSLQVRSKEFFIAAMLSFSK
jgi:hypothetical protein